MDLRRQLLQQLADGRFHSGVQLAAALGISRTSVWKLLHELEPLDLDVQAVSGRGYRISGGLDLLQAEALQQLDLVPPGRLLIGDSVASTQQLVLERWRAEEGPWLALAEHQTAGKGRRGRPWHSPFARNLYLSLLWTLPLSAAELSGISLAVGVVVAEQLIALGIPVRLKWPNDLWLEQRKLGGVLIELVGDLSGPCSLVIGLGLNVQMKRTDSQHIDQPWTDLSRWQHRLPNRTTLASLLLKALVSMLQAYPETGLAPYIARWQQLDALKDQPVLLVQGQNSTAGLARGIAQNGALLIDINGDLREVQGGEVSLRPIR